MTEAKYRLTNPSKATHVDLAEADGTRQIDVDWTQRDPDAHVSPRRVSFALPSVRAMSIPPMARTAKCLLPAYRGSILTDGQGVPGLGK